MNDDVFISYAAKDRERVLGLVKRLRNAGVSVWIDQGGIDISALWSQEIVNAIKTCKVMLLSISPQSTESKNVVKELALCSEREKPIIPVYFERSEIPETMEYQLAGIQRVEYFKDNEDAAFAAILRSLAMRGVAVTSESVKGIQKLDHKPRQTSETIASEIPKRRNFKLRLTTSFLMVLVFACGLIFWWPKTDTKQIPDNTSSSQSEESAQTKEQRSSLAIVPFRNIGPAGENSFLADGMHEEINAMLSMAPNLIVKDGARFKGMSSSVKEIGSSLDVDSILTGSVMQTAGKLRVIVKLIDSKTEANLWANTYDKSEGDFFTIQREIAEQVAQGLSINLNSEYETLINDRQTKNLEAYNLYLEGRLLWNTRDKDKMYQAVEKYELAILKDPQFALGYVGIAECYNMLAAYGFSPTKIAIPKAKMYLDRALQINDKISELHSSLGWYYWIYEYDFDRAEASFRKALSINPSSPEANRWYAQVRSVRFNPDSVGEVEKSVALEPNSPTTRWVQFKVLITFSKFQEAKIVAAKVRELDPNYFYGHLGIIEILCLEGKYNEALVAAENAIVSTEEPIYYGIKGFILGRMNRNAEAIVVLNTLREMSSRKIVSESLLSMIYYSIGDYGKAIEIMKESVGNKTFNTFIWDPRIHWKNLHDNADFIKIFSDLGLPLKI